MSAFTRSFEMIVSINVQLFWAALCSWLTYLLWPTDVLWWGFGVLSIACSLTAVTALITAFKMMAALYMRDRTLAAYRAQAKAQQNAELASEETLKKAGVIDGQSANHYRTCRQAFVGIDHERQSHL